MDAFCFHCVCIVTPLVLDYGLTVDTGSLDCWPSAVHLIFSESYGVIGFRCAVLKIAFPSEVVMWLTWLITGPFKVVVGMRE